MAGQSWRTNLRPASFRGVGFFVDAADMTGGRRVELHEYPQRDKPYAEDLGRKARMVSVQAWLIGDDYAAKRDQLLAKLEEAGIGELVHPWLGSLQVSPGEYSYSESQAEGRMCRFSLQFFEAGELVFPGAAANYGQQSLQAADALDASSIGAFSEVWNVSDTVAVPQAIADVQRVMTTIAGSLDAAVNAGYLNGLSGLLGDPQALAQRILSAIPGGAGLFGSGQQIYGSLSRLRRIWLGSGGSDSGARSGWAGGASSAASESPAVASVQQTTSSNTAALDAFVRRASLSASAREVVAVSHPVADEASALRQDLNAMHDAEQALASGMAVRTALAEQRKAVSRYLQDASRSGARLVDYRPVDVLPAAVIAYELYDDAGRAAEIAQRNRVRHPGFVPVETLRVLDR